MRIGCFWADIPWVAMAHIISDRFWLTVLPVFGRALGLGGRLISGLFMERLCIFSMEAEIATLGENTGVGTLRLADTTGVASVSLGRRMSS